MTQKTALSRYDLDWIVGEAIQLHFHSQSDCRAWIAERMADNLRIPTIEESAQLCEVADGLASVTDHWREVAEKIYLDMVTPES